MPLQKPPRGREADGPRNPIRKKWENKSGGRGRLWVGEAEKEPAKLALFLFLIHIEIMRF